MESEKHELTMAEKEIVRAWHKAIRIKTTPIFPVFGYSKLLKEYPNEVTDYMKTLNPKYEYYRKGHN